jgi:hypothetical protein
MAEGFEFGIRNAECGKKKRRQRTDGFEFGMRNAERKKEDGRRRTDHRE